MTAVLDELEGRGLLALSTDREALAAALTAGPVSFYVGFDPTAPSLHMGNLLQLVLARRLQAAGHRPVIVVGGATGLIGDPRSTGERVLNAPDLVARWVDRIGAQVAPLLLHDGPTAARVVDNLAWTAPLGAVQFLRDIGKHFSVNRMLDREAVATRLAAGGISYTEFSYVLLQAHDYLQLYRQHGVTLQLGGSDQWGNITAGVELVRRVTGARVHALATPLVTRADGTKYGKTEAGAIWLDPELTSPWAFHQFWLNTPDDDAATLLRLFTFLDADAIERLLAEGRARPASRAPQRALADEVTALVHGETTARGVRDAAAALFGSGELGGLDPAALAGALGSVPALTVAGPGPLPGVAELLARAGLVPSVAAGRRTVAEGGAYVNNVRVTDPSAAPTAADLLHGRWLVLRRGRRSVAAVEVGGAADVPAV